MANNIAVTPGDGTKVVRSIDKSGIQAEVMVLDRGGSGAEDLVGSVSTGLYVEPHPCTAVIVATAASLTTATTAYVAGDVLGAELSFANAVLASGRTGTIQSATLSDVAKVTGAIDLYLFDRASTPAADNAANSWADADMLNCLGVVQFPTPIASALNSIAVVPYAGIVVKPNVTTLFGVMVTRTAHTFFGAATDLQVRLSVLQD